MLLSSAAVSTRNGSNTSPTTVLLFKGLLEFPQEYAVSVVINGNLSIAMRSFSIVCFMLLAGGLNFSPVGLTGGQTLVLLKKQEGGLKASTANSFFCVYVCQNSRESNTMFLMENSFPVWNI